MRIRSEKQKISDKKYKELPENKARAREQNKAWREKNKERIKQYMKKYRAENKEKLEALNKKWREENKEWFREHTREYKRKYQTEYARRNPEKTAKSRAKYRDLIFERRYGDFADLKKKSLRIKKLIKETKNV